MQDLERLVDYSYGGLEKIAHGYQRCHDLGKCVSGSCGIAFMRTVLRVFYRRSSWMILILLQETNE